MTSPSDLKPSHQLRAALSGAIPITQAPQEWLSLVIYQKASDVIRRPDKASRREALEKVPEPIRQLVEDEAKRLWEQRK